MPRPCSNDSWSNGRRLVLSNFKQISDVQPLSIETLTSANHMSRSLSLLHALLRMRRHIFAFNPDQGFVEQNARTAWGIKAPPRTKPRGRGNVTKAGRVRSFLSDMYQVPQPYRTQLQQLKSIKKHAAAHLALQSTHLEIIRCRWSTTPVLRSKRLRRSSTLGRPRAFRRTR